MPTDLSPIKVGEIGPWYIICFQGLRAYWHCQFLSATEKEAMAAILIFLNSSLTMLTRTYHFLCEATHNYEGDLISLIFFCLEFPWHLAYIGFFGSASLLALSVFMCDPNRGYGGHRDFIIDLRFTTFILICSYFISGFSAGNKNNV